MSDDILKRLTKLEEQLRYLLRLEKLGPHAETHLPDGSDPVDSSELAWSRAISMYLALPGLRAFWPASSVDENYRIMDLSGQGRHLSYYGDVTYAVDYIGMPPAVYNGNTQYMYRADEDGLDIRGNETGIHPPSRGLTCGGWFRRGNPSATSYMIHKVQSDGLAYAPYSLWHWGAGGYTVFQVSEDGSTRTPVDSLLPVAANTWTFVVGRYKAGAEVRCFVNANSMAATTNIPTSIYASDGVLRVNHMYEVNASNHGFMSLGFLCAAALPDATIQALYQGTRALFGV